MPKHEKNDKSTCEKRLLEAIIVQRTGIARLPLHYGRAPRYLVARMRKMAREMVTIIVDEYGVDEFLRRISDPFWFQAFGCVLGYDWHSSGVTTVITGVLKKAVLPEEHGFGVCGGKGKFSRQVPEEIGALGDRFGFANESVEALRYSSRMSAKVDNTAIQAGYQLYHHAFLVTDEGKWVVVQQGMCATDRTARRYHWLSDKVKDFVVEPQNAIVGEAKREIALDMTSRESEGCRKTCVDLINESPRKLMRMFESAKPHVQKSLTEWLPRKSNEDHAKVSIEMLSMPRNINWKTVQAVYEFQPRNYEELLGFKGVGSATVRGLALVADLIYGQKPSWKDPVKYSFAYGGKDGVPFPVNRSAMDDSIQILKRTIQEARIGDKEKLRSFQRLRRFVPESL